MPKRIPEDTKRRAVRLVLDHVDEYPNLTVACQTVAGRLGFGAESLRPSVESTQFTSVAFAETLALAGIAASIGSIGDSLLTG